MYEDSNPITLNFSEGSQYLWASLSPDQSKILFTKAGEGTYTSDLQGNILVEFGNANAPRWSPDGNWIVYMNDKDNGYYYTASEIFVVSADGSKKYQILESGSLNHQNLKVTRKQVLCKADHGCRYPKKL